MPAYAARIACTNTRKAIDRPYLTRISTFQTAKSNTFARIFSQLCEHADKMTPRVQFRVVIVVQSASQKAFGNAAYIVKARVQLIRDLGSLQSQQNAFYLNLGLETLPLRMEQHSKNAAQVATFLAGHDKVTKISNLGLEDSANHELAQKYLQQGCSGVMTFVLKGGREAGVRFIDSLKLIRLEIHQILRAASC